MHTDVNEVVIRTETQNMGDMSATDFSKDIQNRPNFQMTNNNLASDLYDEGTLDKSLMNFTDG